MIEGKTLLTLIVALAGLAPGPDYLKETVEPLIRSELVDPESARFRWPIGFVEYPLGYGTCGYVNSKNRMGGYNGDETVKVFVYKDGRAPNIEFASEWEWVIRSCKEYASRLSETIQQP